MSGALGLLVEWAMIRHLYARPLDTLLATWGLSLIMQQAFRSIFGAREVGIDLPQWMMGSLPVSGTIEVQINGLFVMGITLLITGVVALLHVSLALGLAGAGGGRQPHHERAPSASTRDASTGSRSGSAAASPASPAAPSR